MIDFSEELKKKSENNIANMTNKIALQTSMQTFIDLYLNESSVSDTHNRLGVPINEVEEDMELKVNDFPPFPNVIKGKFHYRIGGFHQVNNRINEIQSLLQDVTGKIRTQLTEWDISLYLQEGYLDTSNPIQITTLYNIEKDNPSKYEDDRAYSYGMLNCATNPNYTFFNYNPRHNPQLKNWEPPTSKVHISERAKTDPRKPWQLESLNRMLEANILTYLPEYWQLIYNNSDINTLDQDDDNEIDGVSNKKESMFKRIIKLMALKKKKTEEAKNKVNNIKNVNNPPRKESDAGINLKSPYLYGYPIGKELDKDSLLFGGEEPSIPLTKDFSKFIFSNPFITINNIVNGFSSSKRVIEETSQVNLVELEFSDLRPNESWSNLNNNRVTIEETLNSFRSKNENNRFDSSDLFLTTRGFITTFNPPMISTVNTNINPNYTDTFNISPTNSTITFTNNSILKKFKLNIPNDMYLLLADGSLLGVKATLRHEVVGYFLFPRGFWWWKQWKKIEIKRSIIRVNLQDTLLFANPNQLGKPMNPSDPTLLANNRNFYRINFVGLFLGLPALDGEKIFDGWSNYPQLNKFKDVILKASISGLWEKDSLITFIDPIILLKNTSKNLDSLLDKVKMCQSIVLSLNKDVLNKLFSGLEDEMKEDAKVISLFKKLETTLQNPNLVTTINSTSLIEDLVIYAKTKIAEVISLDDLTVSLYKNLMLVLNYISSILTNPLIISIIEDYLEVLYLQRLILIKKRFNKINGSFYLVNQLELSVESIQNNLATKVSSLDSLIKEPMKVLRTIGHLTKSQIFNFRLLEQEIPPNLLIRCYVKANYDENDNLILPEDGTYLIYSNYTLENKGPSVTIDINWSNEALRPKLFKNVNGVLDPFQLIMNASNPDLNLIEVYCNSVEETDVWQIDIPFNPIYKDNLPLLEYYEESEDPYLVKIPSNIELNNYLNVVNGSSNLTSLISPIKKNQQSYQGSDPLTAAENRLKKEI